MLWKKAADDLALARLGLDAEIALDMVGFHAQQAVEKSIKAMIALRDIDYPKTHDIGGLIGIAKPLVDEWPFEDERLKRLSRFAIDARYNDRYLETDLAEAREALDLAETIHVRVGTMIGPDPHIPAKSAEG